MRPGPERNRNVRSTSSSKKEFSMFYSNGDNFEHTFSQQVIMMRRERMIRRVLTFIIMAMTSGFMMYIWLMPVDSPSSSHPSVVNSYNNHYTHSQQKDQLYSNTNNDNHRYQRTRDSATTASWPLKNNDLSSNKEIHLYRILGNDLPPRHKSGQVIQNVGFILANEPTFPNTKKWWVLNRIVDQNYETALIELLTKYDQDYLIIPFKTDEYLKKDFKLEDFPEPDFFHSFEYLNFSRVAKLRTIDYTYHDKNLYAMNNNGGRNFALAHGKTQLNSKWILPLDGNCFLTVNAFNEIVNNLNEYGQQYKYFIVPMARLTDNNKILVNPDVKPETPEEPQIIFRHDSEEKYNENMRYGRRSKLEMLWRLGVPSPRKLLNKPTVPWESNDAAYLKITKNKYKPIGWVFRLFSGQASQELNKREAGALRAFNRLLAIQDFLDGIDERIARSAQGYNPDNLFLYNEKLLYNKRLDYWTGDQEINQVVNILIEKADDVMENVKNFYQPSDKSILSDLSTQVKFLPLLNDEISKMSVDEEEIDKDNKLLQAEDKEYQEAVNKYLKTIYQEDSQSQRENQQVQKNSNEQNKSQSSSDPLLSQQKQEEVRSGTKKDPLLRFDRDQFGQHVSPTPVTLPEINGQELFENITILSFAHYFSSNVDYSRWAANLIRTYILSSYAVGEQDEIHISAYNQDLETIIDEGYSFPHLNKIPRNVPKFITKPNTYKNGFDGLLLSSISSKKSNPQFPFDLFTTDPSYFLDAVRLLYKAKALTHHEFLMVKKFAADWLEYLINSSKGISISKLADHRGILYDIQVITLSGFVDDIRLYLRMINRIRMRIGKHFYIANDASINSEIIQPYEIMYVKKLIERGEISVKDFEKNVFKYKTINLQYWMMLTRIIQNVGVGNDLWQYSAKDGQRLSRVLKGHLNKHYRHTKSKNNYNNNIEWTVNKFIHHIRDHIHSINNSSDEQEYYNELLKRFGDSKEEKEIILRPLIHIAQLAHEISDINRGDWHEYGDEHDYFKHSLTTFGTKTNLLNNSSINNINNIKSSSTGACVSISNDNNDGDYDCKDYLTRMVTKQYEQLSLDIKLGIGKESRERAIPPFWMFDFFRIYDLYKKVLTFLN
ncbi:11313_t:CDS:2 [Entrophospora sp. SA101]|nr:13641_t:CDS:2 [Entrophospora sp. SA101]CAJ0627210.1 11313_t:CDS:2 [Entrophospora sp. SA101]CAJ0837564.1 15210_t:CDS:2 [Entrophospora sp. SA101]CAJ0906010.1 9244_t:CDS:2 [Entrophospora sp. SA101]